MFLEYVILKMKAICLPKTSSVTIYHSTQCGRRKGSEFSKFDIFFLQGLFERILCPEEQPLYLDSLISQLDKLMTCDYPTPESHGHLMSDQFQNLWVMSVLREELELVQNLLLYVDSCELHLKGFLKLFKIILVRRLLDLKCRDIT